MTKRLESIDGIQSVIRDLNVTIFQTSIDGACRGFAKKHRDGYIVVLDENLCFDCKLKTLKHELVHIILGHLDDSEKPEEEKENEVCQNLQVNNS